ncbi:MAG: hypothetical protein WKF96_24910 [Solirubrobacteraceae bacterium]
MSTTTVLTRDSAEQQLSADPVATIALGRDAWAARGAQFHCVPDALGGTAELATAELALPERTIRWAALDHGQATSFLLVDGGQSDAERVIYELLAQHLITPADILERLPATVTDPENLAARLASLENEISDLRRTA